MKKLLAVFTLLLTVCVANAQQVHQSGNVTPGHVTSWTTNGVIQDGGTAANGTLTSLGVTASGPGICLNSGPPTSAYNQICLTATATGLGITGSNVNGASGTVTVQQNGAPIPFGITPFAAPASQWINSISSTGVPSSTQPAASDISGLGSMATQFANAVAITGGTITGMPTPQISTDVATKGYVDINASGFHIHNPVVLATTAPLPAYNWTSTGGGTLTAQSVGALSIDGVAVTGGTGQRVLVKSELNSGTSCNGNVNAACDGIYTVTTAGDAGTAYVLVRSSATDSTGDAENTAAGWQGGDTIAVSSGSINAGTIWANTTKILTLNTTAFSFFQFSSGISQPWQVSGSNIFFTAGNVGIGTASPTSPLTVAGNTQTGTLTATSNPVLINTTSALTLGGSSVIQQIQNPSTGYGQTIGIFSNSGGGAGSTFVKSRGGSWNTHGIVQNGDRLFSLESWGDDGANYQQASRIFGLVDGVPGVGSMPSSLQFATTPSGGTSSIERMRITNAGNVGINNSSPASTLDVAGTLNASGAATLGSTLGVGGALSLTGASGVVSSTNALTMQTTAGTVSLNPATNVVIGGTAPRISGLVSCGTIQTDGSGNTSCGTASGIGFAIDATKAPYSVKCDGATNDTTAISNALAAAAASTNTKTVILPSGTCIITGSLNLSSAGVEIRGSEGGTILQQNTSNSATISITAANVTVSNLTITYSGTAISGGYGVSVNGVQRTVLHDITVNSAYTGFLFTNANSANVYNINTNTNVNSSFDLENSSNVYLSTFLFSAGVNNPGSIGVTNQVVNCHVILNATVAGGTQGNNFVNGTAYGGNCPLSILGSATPSYNKFVSVYFDSGALSATLNGAKATTFTNCWFSTGRGGTSGLNNGSGLVVAGSANEIIVEGSDFQANGAAGIYVAVASNVIIKGNRIDGNGTLTANTYDGVAVANNVNDFHIEGNIIKNSLGSGTQRFAVFVAGTSNNRYTIANNLVTANGSCSGGGSACINDGGTGVSKNVGNNW